METLELTDNLRAIAEKHFVLLQPENIKKNRHLLSLNISGYTDVGYLMSDIVKVCILALDSNGGHGDAHIPEPESNISGVLSILLNLIPYEELELLDHIREEILQPAEEDWDFVLDTIMLTPQWAVPK